MSWGAAYLEKALVLFNSVVPCGLEFKLDCASDNRGWSPHRESLNWPYLCPERESRVFFSPKHNRASSGRLGPNSLLAPAPETVMQFLFSTLFATIF